MMEKLELVTSFESLRAGDLVVERDCTCGKSWCRSMLIRIEDGESLDGVVGPGWSKEPPCYAYDDGSELFICAEVVALGDLFRVVIPPVEEVRETARPKKLERVR
jgi:hypothetical protein